MPIPLIQIFNFNRARVAQQAGRDLYAQDDLMLRFLSLSEARLTFLCQQNNCYTWSVANESTLFALDKHVATGQRRQFGLFPGNRGTGRNHLIACDRSQLRLKDIWRACRMDGLQPLRLKRGQPLPQAPSGHRLVATLIHEADRPGMFDFHFMAQGSSGYFSNMHGVGGAPDMLDGRGQLIRDPRQAWFAHWQTRPAFFLVPHKGIDLRLP